MRILYTTQAALALQCSQLGVRGQYPDAIDQLQLVATNDAPAGIGDFDLWPHLIHRIVGLPALDAPARELSHRIRQVCIEGLGYIGHQLVTQSHIKPSSRKRHRPALSRA
jgi:hypothetical protein